MLNLIHANSRKKGRNWTNKWETRAAPSAPWHLPSTITLTLAEAFTESTSSNDLQQVQAPNPLPAFLASPRQVQHSCEKSMLATQWWQVSALSLLWPSMSTLQEMERAANGREGKKAFLMKSLMFLTWIRLFKVTSITFLLNLFTVKKAVQSNSTPSR